MQPSSAIASLVLILIHLGGCAAPPSSERVSRLNYGPPPQDYEVTIRKYFESVLFDPYSAHYDFEPPQQMWLKDAPLNGGRLHAGHMVRVGVNAKNRFGGYVGKKMHGFIIKDERIIKVMDEFELNNLRTR